MYDTYVSIDLETTGLNPKRDRIIEIGAIRVEQGQIVEEFSTFVDPGRKLEERITELTGIRDEDLADAPVVPKAGRIVLSGGNRWTGIDRIRRKESKQ